MSDKDLLGKADGLMRRHSTVGTDTSAFPVLTDLVDTPPAAEPIESVAVPAAGGEAPPAAPDAPALDADALTAQVMKKVDERLQAEMQRVRSEVAEAVAEAVREILSHRPVK